jgi:excisionase family DNA binding protein
MGELHLKDYVSTETAAHELDLEIRTIQNWCKMKKLKAYKLGKEWRIPRPVWDEFKKRVLIEVS